MSSFHSKPSPSRAAMRMLRLLSAGLILAVMPFASNSASAGVGLSGVGIAPDPSASPPTTTPPLAPSIKLPKPSGNEVCGIVGSTDVIFKNGFEIADQTLAVLRTMRSVTKSPAGSGTPTITITFPAAGQTLASTTTPVTGTFTGPADTGVVVNGVLAYTSGTSFLVPDVPLASGSNTLQAVATTLPGATAQSSVSVTQGGTIGSVALTSTSLTGFAPFATVFSPVITGNVAISQLKIDFDGNGIDDVVTTSPTTPLPHTYATPGLYTARLTIVDNTTTPNPTTYVVYQRVLAQDNVELRETLCSVYGYLRTNLSAANVTSAVLAFDPDRRAHYQNLFGSISNANLPVAASRLGTIANGLISTDYAQLKVVKTFQGTTASFPMNFSRDDSGVWRIDSM